MGVNKCLNDDGRDRVKRYCIPALFTAFLFHVIFNAPFCPFPSQRYCLSVCPLRRLHHLLLPRRPLYIFNPHFFSLSLLTAHNPLLSAWLSILFVAFTIFFLSILLNVRLSSTSLLLSSPSSSRSFFLPLRLSSIQYNYTPSFFIIPLFIFSSLSSISHSALLYYLRLFVHFLHCQLSCISALSFR